MSEPFRNVRSRSAKSLCCRCSSRRPQMKQSRSMTSIGSIVTLTEVGTELLSACSRRFPCTRLGRGDRCKDASCDIMHRFKIIIHCTLFQCWKEFCPQYRPNTDISDTLIKMTLKRGDNFLEGKLIWSPRCNQCCHCLESGRTTERQRNGSLLGVVLDAVGFEVILKLCRPRQPVFPRKLFHGALSSHDAQCRS